jgi:exodeoxyribonuclease-3
LKIATWNVNSIRMRLERLLRWLERQRPDVVCLQELKTPEAGFPFEPLREAGYYAAVCGQRTYNGVAVLSGSEPLEVRRSFDDGVEDPQARFISTLVGGVQILCAYVPNGSTVGSEKWDYKLRWMGRLRKYLDEHCEPSEPLALCGDFNIAPEDRDVANPDKWRDTVLCQEEGRKALREICEWGLVDAFRLKHSEGGLYSWWDYRQLGFPRNDGLRLDHVLVTPALAERCVAAEIDRQERKGKQPSDHAPVIVSFSD